MASGRKHMYKKVDDKMGKMEKKKEKYEGIKRNWKRNNCSYPA
jgi:hypothetical protein